MTTQQQNTVDSLVARIHRANNNQNVSVMNIRKGHILLTVFNVRDKIDWVTTTTFCEVEINTKGTITKGFMDALRPRTETKYPYINN